MYTINMNERSENLRSEESNGRTRRRWLRIVAILSLLSVLILVMLPFGIRYGVQRALLASGADSARIRDIDFNPFSGRLEVDNLEVDAGGLRTLQIPHASVNISWWPLVKHRIVVQDILIKDTVITVERREQGPIRIGGLSFVQSETAPEPQKPANPWEFAVTRLDVQNTEIHYKSPRLDAALHIDDVALSGLESWSYTRPARLRFRGRFNDSPIAIEASLAPFSTTPTVTANIQVDKLSLAPFMRLAQPQLMELDGRLSVDIDVEVEQKNGRLQYVQKGDVTLEGLHAGTEFGVIDDERFDWNGEFDVAQTQDETPQVNASGRILNTGLSFALPEPGKLMVVDLGKLELQELGIDGIESISVAAVDLDDVTLLKSHLAAPASQDKDKQAQVFHGQVIKMKSVLLTDLNNVDVGSSVLQDIDVLVRRDQAGRLYLIDDLLDFLRQHAKEKKGGTESEENSVPTGKNAAPPGPAIHIADIELKGKGHLRFEDESVNPAYRETFQLEKLRLADLDTGKPDQSAHFSLQSLIGKYGRIAVDGSIKPLAPRLTLSLAGKIKAFDLPPLSSYTASSLGYNLTSGTLNADTTLAIENGKIKGTNKLVVNNINVSPQDETKMAQLATQLTMPLDVALSTLTDKNNDVHLDLPVSGDISDPKFSIADVINTAMGKAMKKTAMLVLKNSLQPFGTLITIAQVAGDMAAHVSLDPVKFNAAGSSLDDQAQRYLERVSALMKERPELRIRICGTATESDRRALEENAAKKAAESASKTKPKADAEQAGEAAAAPQVSDEQLQTLANGRAEAVKEHLVRQRNIGPERLFICHPEVERNSEAEPQVKLLI